MNLQDLKSVGPKTLTYLNDIGIFKYQDLLEYYPYKYNYIVFKELIDNELIYVKAEIITNPKVSFIRRNFNRLSFKVLCQNRDFEVTIFNRAFLKQNLLVGKTIVLHGKYNELKNNFMASDIIFNISDNTIVPIYHSNKDIKNNAIRKIMDSALLHQFNVLDKVPSYINDKYEFISKEEAIKFIHKPNSIEEIKKSKLKLIYEELFEFMFKINYLKNKNKNDAGIKRTIKEDDINFFLDNLPFSPTIDQVKAFNEIKEDMNTSKRMKRLVLGDVGSGKTLVAMYAIYLNYLSGYQTAFMAPTEILASQHYNKLIEFSKSYGMNIELLTGKLTKKEKEKIKLKLINNEIDLLIGTHSIISEDVVFKNLGLVITDEEHRFGVIQRKNLENKGINPDILYLSATPIPRTYALVIYKDSDVSIIKTKPVGREEIETKTYKEEDIKVVLEKMYEELKKNNQVFIVSPLIENNEESNLNSVTELKDKFNNAFKNKYIVDIIHGAMKQKEKDLIMEKYINNEIHILISTTVIEVGIDVPNATIMTIFNAERFGLATLHQLRGRVGRSNKKSYCYLISNHDNNRLKVMEESNDGFYITEKDYEERREGDLFGTKQSGDMSFKIASIKRDFEIAIRAQKDSEEFIDSNQYKDNQHYIDIINSIENS